MRILVRTCIPVLFLMALWLSGLYAFTRGMMNEVPVTILKPADAVVVLTGGSNRLQTGFDLLDQNKGKKMFISGVYHGVEVRELLDLWKKDHGDLDCCVVLGFKADDTFGNAEETIEWMKKQKYKSAVLVTANYHLQRAMLAFDRLDAPFAIHPFPVTPEGLDMKDWWRNKTHRTLIMREYTKYLASFIYYLPGITI